MKINKNVEHKILKIFLTIILKYVLAAQKKRLIETVLLSTYNICLVEKKAKKAVLSRGLGLQFTSTGLTLCKLEFPKEVFYKQ